MRYSSEQIEALRARLERRGPSEPELRRAAEMIGQLHVRDLTDFEVCPIGTMARVQELEGESRDLREEVELLRRLLAERNKQLHREAMGTYQREPWTR